MGCCRREVENTLKDRYIYPTYKKCSGSKLQEHLHSIDANVKAPPVLPPSNGIGGNDEDGVKT